MTMAMGMFSGCGGGSPFAAAAVPGLLGEWRSDLGITIGTGVSQWSDQSGLGNHFLQATSGAQPAYSTNGGPNARPCLIGDGVNDMMSLAGNISYGAFTNWLVFKGSTVGMVIEHLAAADSDFLYSNTGGPNIQAQRSSALSTRTLTASTTWGTDGAWHILAHRFDGTNAGHTFEIDGVQPANTNGSASDPGVGVSTNPLNLFGRVSGALFAGCSMAHVLLYGRATTALESTAVRTYLKTLYNL